MMMRVIVLWTVALASVAGMSQSQSFTLKQALNAPVASDPVASLQLPRVDRTLLLEPSKTPFPIRKHLRLVSFHFAGECIGDEVNHVLPRDHSGPWLGTRPARKVSSKGTVVFTRKEK
jgi:hypothetical protein